MSLLLACAGPRLDGPEPVSQDSIEESTDSDVADPDQPDTAETGDSGPSDPCVSPDDCDGDNSPVDVDCDDEDARIYPGAADPCDAVDQDCDGVAQSSGSCGEVVSLDASFTASWVGAQSDEGLHVVEADTDYDGDGTVDLLAFELCLTLESGQYCNENVLFLRGRMPDGEETTPTRDGAAWAGVQGDWLSDAGSAGDFDGDGSTDLFVAARGCAPDAGSLYLVLGPADGWTPAPVREAAAGWWSQAEAGDCFADQASGGYDVDGDGLADLISTDTGTGELDYIRGRSSGIAEGISIRDESWFDTSTEVIGAQAMLPDMDGDGLGELAFTSVPALGMHVTYLVDPVVLAAGASGLGIAEAGDRLDHVGSGLAFLEGASGVGDADGDGYQDVLALTELPASGDEDARLCSLYLPGGAAFRHSGTVDESTLPGAVCVPDGGDSAHSKISDDVDGDGIRDFLHRGPFVNSTRETCLVASSTRPGQGWAWMEDLPAYCFTLEDHAAPWPAVVDLDGDGLPEVIQSHGDDAGGRGRIFVSPGFEIPWEDISYW